MNRYLRGQRWLPLSDLRRGMFLAQFADATRAVTERLPALVVYPNPTRVAMQEFWAILTCDSISAPSH